MNENIKSMKYRGLRIINICFGKIPSKEIRHVWRIVHQIYVELEAPNRCDMLFNWKTIRRYLYKNYYQLLVTLSYLFVYALGCWQHFRMINSHTDLLHLEMKSFIYIYFDWFCLRFSLKPNETIYLSLRPNHKAYILFCL